MELLKDLELVEVNYTDDKKKATLVFLDEAHGVIREVNFNKQIYDNGKYVDSPEKAAKVEEWCKDIFDTTFAKLSSKIGVKKDVYAYDRFSSLFEVEQLAKFTKEQKGKIYQTTIKEILLEEFFIKIRYEIEGKTYESKQTFGKYMEQMKKWFLDPVKKEQELEKFKERYGVPIEERESLIGKKLIVEVKVAFGKFPYGDIKPMM